jgi:hypothetical protein
MEMNVKNRKLHLGDHFNQNLPLMLLREVSKIPKEQHQWLRELLRASFCMLHHTCQ